MKNEGPEHQMQRIKRSEVILPKTATLGTSDRGSEKADQPLRKPLHLHRYADQFSNEELQDFTNPQKPTDAAQT
ncbi:MAG: hypothetical protein SVC26_01365 [Pseudomonadota bacterium]|nr:hypothetical protein [Pseudomonadota bacterium]